MKHPRDAYLPYREKAAEYVGVTYRSRRRRRDPVDPTIDPYAIPLDELNVANPELFKADLVGPYFERLRAEAPVHFCRDSQYGAYWSITRFNDILAVDAAPEVMARAPDGIRIARPDRPCRDLRRGQRRRGARGRGVGLIGLLRLAAAGRPWRRGR